MQTGREPRTTRNSSHPGTDLPCEGANHPPTTELPRPQAFSPERSKEDGRTGAPSELPETAVKVKTAALNDRGEHRVLIR